jgi:hypothetical protein
LAGSAPGPSVHLALQELLQHCSRSAMDLSDRLGHRYFSHADRINSSLVT